MASISKYNEINLFEDVRFNFMSDACLLTDDGYAFRIHKVWLAKNSKYFHEMFCETELSVRDTILIPDIKGEILRMILSFIYTGKVEVTEKNVIEVMKAAYFFSLFDIIFQIKIFIKNILTIQNCIDIYMAARKNSSYGILEKCERFIVVNFEKIISSETFGELHLDSLKQFLKDRNLCVTSERSVYLAILQWIKTDIHSCLPLIPELLTCLSISDMDENLATEILEHDTVLKNPACEDICIIKFFCRKWSNLQVLQYYAEDQDKIPFRGQRLPAKLNFIVRYCVIGGARTFQLYLTYDEKIDLWRKVLETDLSADVIICSEDNIYFFETDENKNFRYSVSDKEWYELNDFKVPRCNFDVVVSEGQIYVLGGVSTITGREIYDVEIYNTFSSEWIRLSSMIPITYFSSVALKESIYVIGYRSEFGEEEMIAQVNNTRTSVWNALPRVSIRRSHFALTAYHEKIYVIGGVNGNNLLRDVEVFDPMKNEWTTECNLPYAYYNPKAIILHDFLIVYDSHLRDREYLRTNQPVFWSIDKKCWERFSELSPMNKLYLYEFFPIENIEIIRKFTKVNRHPCTHFERSPFDFSIKKPHF